MAKRLPGILPGEQNKGKPPKRPRPRSPGLPGGPGPIVKDPAPTSYADLKSAFRTKGKQPGEAAAIGRIAANRDVSREEARKIALNRTSKGLSIKGSAGPNRLGKKDAKVRVDGPVIERGPKDPRPKPTPGPMPKRGK